MDTHIHVLELIHFHLVCTSSVLEMNLLFPAVNLPLHYHHAVVIVLPE